MDLSLVISGLSGVNDYILDFLIASEMEICHGFLGIHREGASLSNPSHCARSEITGDLASLVACDGIL